MKPVFTQTYRGMCDLLRSRGAMSEKEYRNRMRWANVEEGFVIALFILAFVSFLAAVLK